MTELLNGRRWMKTCFLNVKRFVRPKMMIECTHLLLTRWETVRRFSAERRKIRAWLGLTSSQSEAIESAYTTTHNSLPEPASDDLKLDFCEDLHQTEGDKCYRHNDASETEYCRKGLNTVIICYKVNGFKRRQQDCLILNLQCSSSSPTHLRPSAATGTSHSLQRSISIISSRPQPESRTSSLHPP